MTELTHQRLLEVLHYNRKSGVFTWLLHRGPNAHAGSVAGYYQTNGYLAVCIDRRKYLLHRVAWFYVKGQWPEFDIDHRNGKRDQNFFKNLRPATRTQNLCNAAIRSNNTSGVRGVSWDRRAGKWHAYVAMNGRRKFVGYFDDIEIAAQARKAAAIALHGRFAGEVRL